jgi:hypothetical protein
MSNLILPQKWTSQPQYPVEMLGSNPLTNGLKFAWNAATPTLDLLSNERIQPVNGVSPAPTKHGLSGDFTAASMQYYDCGTGQNVTFSGDMTVFIRYSLKSLPASGSAYQLFSRDNDTGGRAFSVDVHNSTRGVRFYAGGGGTVGTNEIVENRTPVAGDDRAVMLVWSPSTNIAEIWTDGMLAATTGAVTIPPSATTSARIGSRAYSGYNEYLNGGVTQICAWGRRLSAVEIAEQFMYPWQIFKAQSRRIFVASAGGAAALASNAAAQASASAAATTAIPITAAALSLSTAGGTLTTAIPLNAVAAAIATSSGEMSTAITLQGGALAASSASGSLTTQILISGSALAQAVSSALLSSGITMTADAVAKAAVQGTLTTAIRMIANASGNASASAAFSGSPAALSAAAYSQATADAQLTISIQLAASALGQADAQGDLTTRVQLSAAALSSAIASGSLSVPVRFSANAFAQATASATLSDSAYISDPRYTATILGREFYVSSFERKFYAARKEVGTGYTVSIAKR